MSVTHPVLPVGHPVLPVVVAAALGVLTNVATGSPTVALSSSSSCWPWRSHLRSGRPPARANRAAVLGPIHPDAPADADELRWLTAPFSPTAL